jgi:hypothetical protein
MPKRLYDLFKFIAQVLLPVVGSLYFILGLQWELTNENTVVGTIVVVDALLGVLLWYSSRRYNRSETRFDGIMDVIQKSGHAKMFSLELNSDPEELDKKTEVTFKVLRHT